MENKNNEAQSTPYSGVDWAGEGKRDKTVLIMNSGESAFLKMHQIVRQGIPPITLTCPLCDKEVPFKSLYLTKSEDSVIIDSSVVHKSDEED